MAVEILSSDVVMDMGVFDDDFSAQDEEVHEIDSRRRLENKIEELRLQKEIQEFDFDL